jgi:hypothetical protein
VLGLAALSACRGRPAAQGGGSTPDPSQDVTLPADRLFLLEAWGAPPSDTTVSLTPGRRRTIVMRHGPPDNTVFAELTLGADATDSSGSSITVTLTPRPGTYGLTIGATPAFTSEVTLRFEYPVHFSAPAAAIAKYGNAARYEAALAIGHQQDDGDFHLLPSSRPAADVLQATIPGAGVYIVAAPK